MALASQELDDLRRLLTSSEAELEGLRAALESAGQRHAAQLASERQQASQQLQRLKGELLGRARERSGQGAELERRLDELLELVQREAARQEAAAEAAHQHQLLLVAAAPGGSRSRSPGRAAGPPALAAAAAAAAAQDASWVPAVLQRVKALALDSEREQQRLRADLHIAQSEAALAHSRLLGLEAALAQRTAEWEAAEAAKQHLARATGRRLEQGAGHTAERLKLQVRRRRRLLPCCPAGLPPWRPTLHRCTLGKGAPWPRASARPPCRAAPPCCRRGASPA